MKTILLIILIKVKDVATKISEATLRTWSVLNMVALLTMLFEIRFEFNSLALSR